MLDTTYGAVAPSVPRQPCAPPHPGHADRVRTPGRRTAAGARPPTLRPGTDAPHAVRADPFTPVRAGPAAVWCPMSRAAPRRPAGPSPERSLLASALGDPGRLPEILAAFAVARHGHAAADSVARLRHDHPGASTPELRAQVITRGHRAVVAEGAMVGGPFLVLVPFAFCAALLRQGRTVLELAALDGHDPTTSARVAELLALQGVYEDTPRAQEALAGIARAEPLPSLKRWPAMWRLTVRMAYLLGLVTTGDDTAGVGRVRRIAVQTGRWTLVVAVFLVGLVAPLVWLPYLAYVYRRSDNRLMERALAQYGAVSAPAPRRRIAGIEPEMLSAGLRACVSLLVPLALVTLAVVADLRIAGSRWPVLAIALAVASFLAGGLWLWRRHRRRTGRA
ncbi:hypothetical protein GCM10023335_60850 [Streptomyces siamensis]|uniref:Uncharacterized protein n=1 Tax=Streptomyces siamensis TaxID=1274986 RepID=A0ABP9JBU5_9ACTN